MQATPHKGNNFDFLRMLLAVLVIWSHSYALGANAEKSEPIAILSLHQTTAGGIAVDSFFILSGYLISQSWLRSSGFWLYIKKRVARIYPGFVIAMALCVFVVAPLSHVKQWRVVKADLLPRFITNTANLEGTPIQGTFASNIYPDTVNGSIWSIRFEFWCYIGLACLGFVGILKRPAWLLGFFLTLILIRLGFLTTGWNPGFKIVGRIVGWPLLWSRILPLFTAGIVYAAWASKIPLNAKLLSVAFGVLVLGVFIPHGLAVAFPTAGAYLLFWFGLSPLIRMHNFGRYGDFSYGTYLYAFPIQQLLVHWNGGTMNPYILFAIATPASVLAGVLSWYVIERHFLKLRKSPIQAA